MTIMHGYQISNKYREGEGIARYIESILILMAVVKFCQGLHDC